MKWSIPAAGSLAALADAPHLCTSQPRGIPRMQVVSPARTKLAAPKQAGAKCPFLPVFFQLAMHVM